MASGCRFLKGEIKMLVREKGVEGIVGRSGKEGI